MKKVSVVGLPGNQFELAHSMDLSRNKKIGTKKRSFDFEPGELDGLDVKFCADYESEIISRIGWTVFAQSAKNIHIPFLQINMDPNRSVILPRERAQKNTSDTVQSGFEIFFLMDL